MDVTHVPEFGRLRYVHVTVDIYSKFIWATTQPGEKALHVCKHLTSCFAVMGVPEQQKPDNGPAYTSELVRKFLLMWNMQHVRGLPNSPTGQTIVEHSNHTLKNYLSKFNSISDPKERLHKTLFVMNHLCVFGDNDELPVVIHNTCVARATPEVVMRVTYRDPKTGLWKGPANVIFSGRGYMCVSTPTGPLWVPSKWTRAATATPTPKTADEEEKE